VEVVGVGNDSMTRGGGVFVLVVLDVLYTDVRNKNIYI
jgi:hypothetical protein